MLNACPSSVDFALPLAAAQPKPRRHVPVLPLFHELSEQAQAEILCYVEDDSQPPDEWTEEDIVFVQWRLLKSVRALADPLTPLAEKLDILNWVFADPAKDALPFSFAQCVAVVGCSPLSPADYFGRIDPSGIREWILAKAASWMRASLERYPSWVRSLIAGDPDHVVRQLERNPQWLNEQIKKRGAGSDLFD